MLLKINNCFCLKTDYPGAHYFCEKVPISSGLSAFLEFDALRPVQPADSLCVWSVMT